VARTAGKNLLSELPEVNLARRVLQKYKLEPPINVLALASRYAKVETLSLSLNIDGVSLHIKSNRRRPTIILNESRPHTRKRFTLAHEIGHILIPWHVGTIVDDIDVSEGSSDSSYWELEGEANRFAAELLMPQWWLREITNRYKNPCEMLSVIKEHADVSVDAALIRLVSALMPGYLYALVNEEGFVVSSGRSEGTLVGRLERGSFVDLRVAFQASDARWCMPFRGGTCIWWRFSREQALPKISDGRKWREILNNILDDLNIAEPNLESTRQTINAIVAYANSMVSNDLRLKNLPKTPEAIYSAAMQRFESRMRDNPILQEAVYHPEFAAYLAQRVIGLVSQPPRRRSR
jgi:Zn-dependent peptidase ImmA (M78 family)